MTTAARHRKVDAMIPSHLLDRQGLHSDYRVVFRVDHKGRHRDAIQHGLGGVPRVVLVRIPVAVQLADCRLFHLPQGPRQEDRPPVDPVGEGRAEHRGEHRGLEADDNGEVHAPLPEGALQGHSGQLHVHRRSEGHRGLEAHGRALLPEVSQEDRRAHGEAHAEERSGGALRGDVLDDLREVLPSVQAAEARRGHRRPSDAPVVQRHGLEARLPEVPHGLLHEARVAAVVQAGQDEHHAVLAAGRRLPPMEGHGAPVPQSEELEVAGRAPWGQSGPQGAPGRRDVTAELQHGMRPILPEQEPHLLEEVLVLRLAFLHRRMDELGALQLLSEIALEQRHPHEKGAAGAQGGACRDIPQRHRCERAANRSADDEGVVFHEMRWRAPGA
mmetsp:Transcript_29619/g.84472  ORF Transcript_29619/g.84472 Transcript_29619/m.84472 type:complete len:386 (+) Transcript_29619:341-1498(+)